MAWFFINKWLIAKGWFALLFVVVALVTVWIWPGLNIPPVTVIDAQSNYHENAQTLYFLSAIAQSLAAILALVFTLSLIAFQMNARYSQRPYSNYFNSFTLVYIILFAISIFLPLYLIQCPNPVAVKISLSLASVCLFLLIPYFLNLRQRLSPDYNLGELYRRTSKKIQNGETDLKHEIDIIENYIMSAFNISDFATYKQGIQILGDLAYEAEEYKENAPDSDTLDILHRLDAIGYRAIDTPGFQEEVPKMFLANCDRGIKSKQLKITDTFLWRLIFATQESIGKNNDHLTRIIIQNLSGTTERATEKDIPITLGQSFITTITKLGENSIDKKLTSSVSETVSTLGEVVQHLIQTNTEDTAAYSLFAFFQFIDKIPGEFFKDDIARRTCDRLLIIGAISMAHKYEKITSETAQKLKQLEIRFGNELIPYRFNSLKYSKKWGEHLVHYREFYNGFKQSENSLVLSAAWSQALSAARDNLL